MSCTSSACDDFSGGAAERAAAPAWARLLARYVTDAAESWGLALITPGTAALALGSALEGSQEVAAAAAGMWSALLLLAAGTALLLLSALHAEAQSQVKLEEAQARTDAAQARLEELRSRTNSATCARQSAEE